MDAQLTARSCVPIARGRAKTHKDVGSAWEGRRIKFEGRRRHLAGISVAVSPRCSREQRHHEQAVPCRSDGEPLPVADHARLVLAAPEGLRGSFLGACNRNCLCPARASRSPAPSRGSNRAGPNVGCSASKKTPEMRPRRPQPLTSTTRLVCSTSLCTNPEP